MRMSCTGTRKRFAPGSCKSFGRSRAITWSTLALRSLTGFSVMNMKPELRWPPPVKPTTFSTAGSLRTISAKSESFSRIAWNEMPWSAWIEPIIRPTSCWGKKPLGTK